MAFTIDDFRDLVRLVEQHPEWRAELRRLVLTEELLDLPGVVRDLAEQVRLLVDAQRRTDDRIAELAEAQRQMVRRQDQMVERQDQTVQRLDQTVQRLDQMVERQDQTVEHLDRTVQRLDRMEQRQGQMGDQLNALRGNALEVRYRAYAASYFGRLLRRIRLARPNELDDLTEEGISAGAFDEEAALDLRLADVIARGRRPGEDRETFLVVEVSVGIGTGDVERAIRRADVLRRVRPTLAVVAGDWVTPEGQRLAQAAGVSIVLDGRAVDPAGQHRDTA